MPENTEKNGGKLPVGYISINEAIRLAEEVGITTTTATMIIWVEKHNLGFQPGGLNSKWYVREADFKEFLNGKTSSTKS